MSTNHTTMIQTKRAAQVGQKMDIPVAQRLLMRPDEAAAMLSVGRSTIYELMRRGELPSVHIGRASRIPTSAIVHFVKRQTQPARP